MTKYPSGFEVCEENFKKQLGDFWGFYKILSNLAIRNSLIRSKLVLRNHYLWPICHLLLKDKELLALRNNFRATKKFLIAKFDCTCPLLTAITFLTYCIIPSTNIVHSKDCKVVELSGRNFVFLKLHFLGLQPTQIKHDEIWKNLGSKIMIPPSSTIAAPHFTFSSCKSAHWLHFDEQRLWQLYFMLSYPVSLS